MNGVIDHHHKNLNFLDSIELAELHAHMGASLSATELWDLAHNQGILLPTKNFREFEKLVSVTEKKDFEEQIKFFDLTERIQSSPDAMFAAMEHVISEAYRKSNITTLELRFNPMLRTRHNEIDMDYILVYALQGMERAVLKYNIKVGVILIMDRSLSPEQNLIIAKKAAKYSDRGVVGLDFAGPTHPNDYSKNFSVDSLIEPIQIARQAGLGITIHTGEKTGVDEMWEVVNKLAPERIGHGIAAVKDEALLHKLAETNTVLELCPSSNIHTKVVADWEEYKHIVSRLKQSNVAFTINTDWPAVLAISVRDEFAKLLDKQVITEADILKANDTAKHATFIK